ncbi:MAG: ABC transporter permease [Sphingomonadaceae bacterium]|nr:ABC transporter permease [Sphingomonadaceae bacterium]
MMGLFEAAWVIARRDFIATVYSRTFILFLLMPLFMFGVATMAGQAGARADREAQQAQVALVTDSQTVATLQAARDALVENTSELSFPQLRAVAPAEHPDIQARALLADETAAYSAVFTGTLDHPVLTGPSKIDDNVGRRMALILDRARSETALAGAHISVSQAGFQRVLTQEAAGNLHSVRHVMARVAQTIIFAVTLLLCTMMVTNLIEEKSNKVIEVLAASVPLDAVFLGKLIAWLGVSLLGMALWSGVLGLLYLFTQVLSQWVNVPVAPAIGWPIFFVLALLYFTSNFMLLGAIFLSVGAQASNVKEIQTISMPITIMQVMILLLAGTVVSASGGLLPWAAFIFPLSSPLSMLAVAVQSETLWPHLLALVWQVLWIAIFVRIAAVMFRQTVMKSGGKVSLFPSLRAKS